MMKKHLFSLLFCAVTSVVYATDNYTIVISLDGCRNDYTEWYDTPFFDYVAEVGVKAGLIPSFPSKTFPNHYTLATGLYPDHHGIIANKFYDRKTGETFSLSNLEQKKNPVYYGGEPVWITAKRQGVRSAVFYWPGSDVKICGGYPDLYHDYDTEPRLTFEERIEGIIAQMALPENERPKLVMAYFEQPDYSGHSYGPQSKVTRSNVQHMDSLMLYLYFNLQKLPYADKINIVFVADHGMASVTPDRAISLNGVLKDEWIEKREGNIPECIYAKPQFVDSVYNAVKTLDHVKVWKPGEVPEYLHYGSNSRIGDVVVLPDLGYIVYENGEPSKGQHGFDPFFNDMHALFRAVGPDFKKGFVTADFPNVNVYALICKLLDITPAPNDGNVEAVSHILSGN